MQTFTATAAPGLEPVVAREIQELGLDLEVKPGRVEFRGTLDQARLAARLRTPSRLLLELDQGPARSYEEP